MNYLIILIFFLVIALIIFILTKQYKKENKTQLSFRDQAKLDQSIEDAKLRLLNNTIQEKQKISSKNIRPSKNLMNEIDRFKYFYDIGNYKLTQLIRNGIQKCNNQNYKEALEDFNRAIELKPDESTSYYCRGLVKLISKNHENILEDFNEALRLQMNEQNIIYYMGLANYETGDFGSAIKDFSRYINEVSDFAETYFNIAMCYKKLKDYQKAIEFFTETINKNSYHEAAYFERGLIKNILEDKEGCCKDLKKAMELGHLEAYHYIKELCETGSQ